MDFKKIPFEQNDKIELTDAEAHYIDNKEGVYPEYLLSEGVCRLNGAQALCYARCRKLDNGKKIYMHRPTRQIFDLAQTSAMKRPSLFEETIMTNCWLAGNKEILDDVELFYGAARKVNEITKVAEAELKKL